MQRQKEIPFEKQKGLGLYLNNDLDNKTYEKCDVNVIFDEIKKILEEDLHNHFRSF